MAEQMSKWQPIETAPTDEQTVILWGRYWSDAQGWFREPLCGRWNERLQHWEAGAMHQYPFGVRPTHWHPLPAPPQSTE
jgi:hypothetical protein